jgi:hypothetical protein
MTNTQLKVLAYGVLPLSMLLLLTTLIALVLNVGGRTDTTEADVHAGRCWVDLNGAPADRLDLATYSCAPAHDPDGNGVERVWEDGSGSYAGDAWVFDPEGHGFVPPAPSLRPLPPLGS